VWIRTGRIGMCRGIWWGRVEWGRRLGPEDRLKAAAQKYDTCVYSDSTQQPGFGMMIWLLSFPILWIRESRCYRAMAIAWTAVTLLGCSFAFASPGPFDGTYSGTFVLTGFQNDPKCHIDDDGRLTIDVSENVLRATISNTRVPVKISPDGGFAATRIQPDSGRLIRLSGRIVGRKMDLQWSSPQCHYLASLERAPPAASPSHTLPLASSHDKPARRAPSSHPPVSVVPPLTSKPEPGVLWMGRP
jgi:hypothetical protein